MKGAQSHEELICWQRAHELRLAVYALVDSGSITRDIKLRDQLRDSASSAPRQMAEGFGRYYPADFSRFLRSANGELKEVQDALRDGVARGHFSLEQITPLLRLAKRASKASTRLIEYLRTATPPHETPPPRRRQSPAKPSSDRKQEEAGTKEPDEPKNPLNRTH